PELTPAPKVSEISRTEPVALAWAPRQSSPTAPATAAPPPKPTPRTLPPEPEEEVPQLIAAEFALGTRRNKLSKMLSRLRFIRLDTRGKAIFLACAALI